MSSFNKILVVLALTILTIPAMADTSVEIIGGGLTYHVIDIAGNSNLNTNQLSPDGRLIANFMTGVMVTTTDGGIFKSYGLFGGNNSVNQPMVGGLYEQGWVMGHWQIGGVAGAYIQNDDTFAQIGFGQTTSVVNNGNGTSTTYVTPNQHEQPFHMATIGAYGIVPILGIAINYKLPLGDKYYLKLNNIISPVITNTSLSFGMNF